MPTYWFQLQALTSLWLGAFSTYWSLLNLGSGQTRSAKELTSSRNSLQEMAEGSCYLVGITLSHIQHSLPKCPRRIESQLPTAPNCLVTYSLLICHPSWLTSSPPYWCFLVSPSKWAACTHILYQRPLWEYLIYQAFTRVERRGLLCLLQEILRRKKPQDLTVYQLWGSWKGRGQCHLQF